MNFHPKRWVGALAFVGIVVAVLVMTLGSEVGTDPRATNLIIFHTFFQWPCLALPDPEAVLGLRAKTG